MAHTVFLPESAGLEYTVKNIAKNTEQKKKQKMRKDKYYEEIIQKGQYWVVGVPKKQSRENRRKV